MKNQMNLILMNLEMCAFQLKLNLKHNSSTIFEFGQTSEWQEKQLLTTETGREMTFQEVFFSCSSHSVGVGVGGDEPLSCGRHNGDVTNNDRKL